eukprot:TRINITY_DN12145_c0_g1_i1.p1 TRINITY_DN12145_c0_g1~~TRINITY_DN12145_c0_g1_i1.p1  ORF type:complete len:334 (-),score=60.66 TRINITY_DN12145_c0_g1_i1:37-1038(-)
MTTTAQLIPLEETTGHEDHTWCVCWTKDGNLLASCGADKSIRLWNRRQPDNKWVCRQTFESAHERTIRRIDFSADGKFLAAASFDSTASVYEMMQNGLYELVSTLEGHENEVKASSWDRTGTKLATCSRDKSVWVWEMLADMEFECISVCSGHSQDVKNVKWHPQKEMLLSCSYDDTIKVWQSDSDDYCLAQTLEGHASTVWDFAFSPDGNYLASVGEDKKLLIWECQIKSASDTNVYTGKYVWKLIQKIENVHSRSIYSVDWSVNNVIATGCSDNAIRIFVKDPTSNEFVLKVTKSNAHLSDINCVAWNPQVPSLLASCGDDELIKFWQFSI